MFKEFKKQRRKLQAYTSVALPLVLAGGWFYPPLGFTLLICMFGAVGIALYKGRVWCDWMCPRGSFYDLFLEKLSRKLPIPALFRKNWFRTVVLSLLMAALGAQIYYAWGDSFGIGRAFVMVLTITTTVGIVLGAVFKPRAWCQICPMGTLGSWISRGKQPLYVSEQCRDCSLCAKVCPMQLSPGEMKGGLMTDGDCIKCSSCVAACPVKALNFRKEIKKAA
ncbi:MAG: 4Fe-4S binding protein [Nitrospiraceae bacterium]|nr:MAG: 4Fe-4S binding protein [Nitrospiraceae bacterium]